VSFPAPLDDCYDAMAWVYRNIRKHGGDPTRIHLGGHSAGGHLAALAALRPGGFAARGIPEDFLAACHPMSTPFDLRAGERVGPEQAAIEEFLGSVDPADASPITFVGRKSLPFFISYGARDMARIVTESRQMAAALRAAGTPVIEQEYAGLDHFEVNEKCGDVDFPWVQTMRSCLGSCWPSQATG
jgi:acetyl esterase/lipase